MDEGLTVAQQKALEALLGGASDTEAAKAAGVARTTVCGWRNHDAAFAAAMATAREACWQANEVRLQMVVGKALDVLLGLLDSPLPDIQLKAAQATLRAALPSVPVALAAFPQAQGELLAGHTDEELLWLYEREARRLREAIGGGQAETVGLKG